MVLHRLSVLETIVVMYCQSEWQISLQKSRFLPFIEKPFVFGMQTSGTIVADGICSTSREKLKVGKWPTGMIQKEWIIQNVAYKK